MGHRDDRGGPEPRERLEPVRSADLVRRAKDRHARTEQMISIRAAPSGTSRVRLPDRIPRPLSRSHLAGQLPRQPLRDHGPRPQRDSRPGAAEALRKSQLLRRSALRFPSRHGRRVHRPRPGPRGIREGAEAGDRLPLGPGPQTGTRPPVRLRDRWGDWAALGKDLPSTERNIALYLAGRPGAFGFAFELLDQNLRILLLSA